MVESQVAPTLAAVLVAGTGGDIDEMFVEFREMVARGYKRLHGLKEALVRDAAHDIEDMQFWFDLQTVEF